MTYANVFKRWLAAVVLPAVLPVSTVYSAEPWALYWDQIELKSASGVPDGSQHNYALTGVLTYREQNCGFCNYFDGWAEVSSRWDGASQEASENFVMKGNMEGAVTVTFRCNADPWIHVASCVRTKLSANQSAPADPGINWASLYDKLGKPFTTSRVTLQQAQALSAHAGSQPPPPPPPPSKYKNIKPEVAKSLNFRPDSSGNGTGQHGKGHSNPQPGQPKKAASPATLRGVDPQTEPPPKVINPSAVRTLDPRTKPPGEAALTPKASVIAP